MIQVNYMKSVLRFGIYAKRWVILGWSNMVSRRSWTGPEFRTPGPVQLRLETKTDPEQPYMNPLLVQILNVRTDLT